MSKICQDFIRWIVGISGARLFPPKEAVWISKFSNFMNILNCKRDLGSFLGFLGFQNLNNIGFGAQGHVHKSRNHRNERFEGYPINKSRSYRFKLEQNNRTELLNISFPYTYHNKRPHNRNTYRDMFEDLKDSKMLSSRNTKIPPSIIQKISRFFQHYFKCNRSCLSFTVRLSTIKIY